MNGRRFGTWIYPLLACSVNLSGGDRCSIQPLVLTATENKELLTSPGYPQNYGRALLCKWLIRVPGEDNVIRLKVLDTQLEPSTGCGSDFVRVHDGPHRIFRVLFQWCGHRIPSLLPTGHEVLIVFKSNLYDSRRGFAIEYWSERKVIVKDARVLVNPSQYVLFGVMAFTGCSVVALVVALTLSKRIKEILGAFRVRAHEESPPSIESREFDSLAVRSLSATKLERDSKHTSLWKATIQRNENLFRLGCDLHFTNKKTYLPKIWPPKTMKNLTFSLDRNSLLN